MTAWEDIAASLLDAELEANVYAVPEEQPSLPALVVTPAEPWIVPGTFGQDTERYAVWVYVAAQDVASAVVQLYALVGAVREALAATLAVEEVGAMEMTDTSGASAVRVPIRVRIGITE